MRQGRMLLKRFANAVVMLLVASGLLLAPLAAPVIAGPASSADHHHHDMLAISGDMQTMSDEVQAEAQAMADDMPCCPGQTGVKDCGSCPFVALCLLNVSLPAPSGAMALIERHARHNSLAPSDDLLIDGL